MDSYPRPQSPAYAAGVLFDEGRFLARSDPHRTERKLAGPGRPGSVDGLAAKVERREALRPTSLGARGWRHQLRKAGPLLRLKGARWCPGASRRSTPRFSLRGIGKPRTHRVARIRTLGCLKFESEIVKRRSAQQLQVSSPA